VGWALPTTAFIAREKIRFLGKIPPSYSIDRVKTGYYCSEEFRIVIRNLKKSVAFFFRFDLRS